MEQKMVKLLESKPKVIIENEKLSAVILDIKTYQEILERLEDVEDLAELKEMRKKKLNFRNFADFLKESSLNV
jgi:hypothetical protein